MIFDVDSTRGKKVRILDQMGREIPFVRSFNTETCEIEFYIKGKDSNHMLTELDEDGDPQAKVIKTVWLGAKAEVDGVVHQEVQCGAV